MIASSIGWVWIVSAVVGIAAINILYLPSLKPTRSELQVTDEFRAICEEIKNENHTENEWAEIESDDMFQSPSFCGGFDATENAFTFSYYDETGKEFWFQLSLAEVLEIAEGRRTWLEIRPAG